jgi:hypothetical protein
MPRFMALLTLALMGACGGGSDDISNPPGSQSFTLSVTGSGTGSGRVVTSGASPALDCSMTADGQSSGPCSGSYPEGTAVDIAVTPNTGSTFTGWSGDASSCGTTVSCPIAMTGNKTAVAQLSTATTAGIEITSSAWYPDPDFAGEGVIQWVVEVRNTTAQVVEVAKVDFASHDAAGNVLASDFTFVGPIPPGETRANESVADYLGTEATADIQLTEVQFATEDPGLGAAQIVSSNWRVDPDFAGEGAIIWTVEVQNTSADLMEAVQVDFITYDASGKILDYDFTSVGPIPPGERRASEGQAVLRGNETSVNFQVAGVTHSDNLRMALNAPTRLLGRN